MKILAYLALATLLIGAATGYTAWVYDKGKADCQAVHDRAARDASDQALVKADSQAKDDGLIGLSATVDVHDITANTAARRVAVAVADLTPVKPAVTGGPDAARACPDVLSGRFVRLFNGGDEGAAPAAAPASGPTGVPGGG